MKFARLIIGIFIVIGALFFHYLTASAIPPLPSGFYGTVKVNGSNVALGTMVSALINGTQYAFTNTTLYNGDTVYTLDVPGDDPATPSTIEGGVPGNTIVFYIQGKPASQTALWQSGTNFRLDLTAQLDWKYTFLPSVFK